MSDWLAKNAVRVIVIIGIAALVIGFIALRSCQSAGGAKAQSDLATGQTGAAVKSGSDAVQTIGNRQVDDADIQQTVKDGTDEIHNAPAGNSNDAADRALCRMRSYRALPQCVALLGPAP